ncbi:MAG: polysaccharide biosynthesis tyrosine autokinase [Chloroflexi bacterium]|nr:polysaccharide biosynthesis tyrosine autokinase [Chloroflexota bacterium]
MELKRYLVVIWKWSWMIVLSVGLAAGLSYLATSRQSSIYQASARLIVGQGVQNPNPSPQDFATSAALALTYIEIAKTTPVIKGTIDTLGLKLSPDTLRERFRASVVPGTQLIELRVDDTDPARAQLLANELAYQLTLQGPAAQQEPKQRDFIRQQTEALQKKIEEEQKLINELRVSLQASPGARDLAAKQQEITTREAQVGQWQQTYTNLAQLLVSRSPNYLSIVEPAQLPARPYAPNLLVNIVLAAVIGLVLSLGATVLVEYLDDTLKHADDVVRWLNLPILGSLARIGNGKNPWWSQLPFMRAPAVTKDENADEFGNAPERIDFSSVTGPLSEKLVTILATRSSDAEAYRVLRTNIQFHGVDKPVRSLMITSAGIGEGKSVTAANLAATLAHAGMRVILIDSDLRRPSQHRLFGFMNTMGLTDSLLTHASPTYHLHATPLDNLRVLTTGALPPNPSELLGSQRMRTLKQQLESEADLLVFDAPPCLPVTDPAVLANLVDGVLMVVDVTHTRRHEAQRAKEILTQVGARILGVVINRVAFPKNDYYYYEYAPSGEKRRKRRTKPASNLAPGLTTGK